MGLSPEVRAAGGVVVHGEGAGVEVLVIHRPRYDDWSLPKGKLEPDETWEAGALREVEEESGLRCALGRELASAGYLNHRGRSKLVRYWEMTPLAGAFVPHEEVDEVRWLPLAAAAALLTYDRDRDVLASLR